MMTLRTESELEAEDYDRLTEWLSPVAPADETDNNCGTNQEWAEQECRRVNQHPARRAEIGSDGNGMIAVFVK